MKIHKFVCIQDHTFFLPLKLPVSLDVVVNILTNMSCPLCNSKEIMIDVNTPFEILEGK